MTLLQPVLDQISKLWTRVDLLPVVRWATVTQANPLRIRLDGDADALPFTPQSALPALRIGDRVVCVEQHRRVIVVQAAGYRETRALPAAQVGTGPSAFTLTAAAASWQAVGLSLTYTPPADLWVDMEASAEVAGGTGATISYTMIGVNITGGLVLAPDTPPEGGASASHWTRFSFSPVHTAIQNPTKRILLPGGVATTFTFWARRNAVPSAGSNVCNYPMITLRPVRWA